MGPLELLGLELFLPLTGVMADMPEVPWPGVKFDMSGNKGSIEMFTCLRAFLVTSLGRPLNTFLLVSIT